MGFAIWASRATQVPWSDRKRELKPSKQSSATLVSCGSARGNSLIHRLVRLKLRIRRIADHPAIAQLNSARSVSGIRVRVRDLNNGCTLLIEFAKHFHNFFCL